nr:hypothetical protein [uncultured Undibacterium sp.]
MKKILTIWMQPVYARLNVDSKRTLVLGLLFIPLVAQIIAAILFFVRADIVTAKVFFEAFIYSFLLTLFLLFFIWFISLVQSIGLQFSPSNAGLVPGHKKNMQIALAVPIIILALAAVAGFKFFQNSYSMWPAFFAVIVMLFLVLIMRSQWMVLPMVLSMQIPALARRAGYSDIDGIIAAKLGLPISTILLVLTLVFLFGGIHWVFSIRDDSLFKMHRRTLNFRAGILGQRVAESQVGVSFSVLCIAWMSSCVSRVTQKQQADATKLLGFAFGTKSHWTTICFQIFSMAFGGVVVVAILDGLSVRQSEDFIAGFGVGFCAVMAMMLPLVFCMVLFYSLYQTRVEQALLCMAPKMGNSKQRDQSFLWYLLRQFIVLYSISVTVALAILFFVPMSEIKQAILILSITCLFPLILNLAKQFSRMKAVNDHPMLRNLLLCALLMMFGIVIILLITPMVLWVYTPLVILVTAYLLWKQIRNHTKEHLFPVGCAV